MLNYIITRINIRDPSVDRMIQKVLCTFFTPVDASKLINIEIISSHCPVLFPRRIEGIKGINDNPGTNSLKEFFHRNLLLRYKIVPPPILSILNNCRDIKF